MDKKTFLILFILITCLFCSFTLQHNLELIYPSLEERVEVRKYSTEDVIPNYKLNVNEKTEAINKIIDILQNVPSEIQKICNENNFTIVIYDGKLTDNENMHKFKGVTPPNWKEEFTWEDAIGAYYEGSKEAYIRQHYKKSEIGSISMELHEYGHLVDHAFFYLSESEEFKEIYNKSKQYESILKISKMSKYERNSINEFFAESFAKYYFTDKSRKRLEKDFPETYDFFYKLEKEIVENHSNN